MVNKIQAADGNTYVVEEMQESVGGGKVSFDALVNSKVREISLEDIFQKAARQYDIPCSLLKAVAQAESGFDAQVVSPCGASGIMQLMPQTAEGLGVTDIFDPEQNINGGAKLLSSMIECYNGDVAMALAAYNAGWGAVEKYNGIPPYEETQNYISRVFRILEEGQEADLSETVYPAAAPVSQTPAEAYVSGATAQSGNTFIESDKKKLFSIALGKNSQGQEMTLTEYISYANYMKLLDDFQDILKKVFFQNADEKAETQWSKNTQTQSGFTDNTAQSLYTLASQTQDENQAKALYELSSSLYNAKARSLMNI